MTATATHAANLLTLMRLLCIPPIVLLMLGGDHATASLLFALAAFTDFADGFIAKRFNSITALGAVLDPAADKLLMASVFVTMALDGALPVWFVALVLARDLLIVGGTVALRLLAGSFRVEPLLIGKLCTFLQLVLAGAVLIRLSLYPPLAPWLDGLILLTAVLVVVSALAYVHAATRIWSLARAAAR